MARERKEDIAWCEVLGGKIALEGNAGVLPLEPFHIAKYPVTRSQHRSFLEAQDGFRDERWWHGLAERPREPGKSRWMLDNHTAEHVSWCDAVAFCRWLNEKLSDDEIRERFGEDLSSSYPPRGNGSRRQMGAIP